MDKKILVILLTTIITISACPQSSVDFNPNAGIVLQDVSFDIPKVYDDGDDKTSLMFDVVNVGGKKIASDDTINVYVYGPTIAKSGTDVWISEDAGDGGYITEAVEGNELPPPDPSMGIPGGRIPQEFEFKPAKVLSGMEIPTKFYVSVCYPYTTQTLTQVEVTSKNELRATGITGSRKDTVNAGGPIHITLQGKASIRSGSNSIPLVFKVDNVGGGYPAEKPCEVDLSKSDRDKVTISVSVDGNTKDVKCGSDAKTNSDTVNLRKGSSAIFCTYDVETASSTTAAPRRTYMVRAIAEYQYYVTSTVSITTVGTSDV
ncbi:MAG: hypothetical protein U9Q92_05170 [archaeon]|nr:hypothetical protein [archaeon]